MATVLVSSQPQPLSKPPSSLAHHPTPSQRLSTSLRRSRYRSSHPLHSSSSPTDWSFEQRIQESLAIVDLMEAESIPPDPTLFCTILKSCADAGNLHFGRLTHDKVLRYGLQNDPFVANNLIQLYSKCGLIGIARQLFDEMPVKTVVSWTTAISMYHHAGFPHDALDLYRLMKADAGISPNVFTYTIVLNSCASIGDLEMGIGVHNQIVEDGCDGDEFIVVALIDMYAKCGCVHDARKVLDRVPNPSVEAFTAMIEGYSGHGDAEEAMCLTRRALRLGPVAEIANKLGFATMIRPCIMELALRQGKEIHAHIIKFGHNPGIKTLCLLVELYEKCDKVVIAHRLFNGLGSKDVGLRSRIISGFVRNRLYKEAIEIYSEMVRSGAGLNSLMVCQGLKACVGVLDLEEGKQIHCRVIKECNLLDDSVIGCLVELYRSCGEHKQAYEVQKLQRK